MIQRYDMLQPCVLVAQLCLTLCDPVDCSLPGSSVHGMNSPGQEYWSWLPFPSQGDLPEPGIELGSPALQADSLSSEPPGKVLRYFSSSKIQLNLMVPASATYWESLVAQLVKNPSANTGDARDAGSILGSGRFPGEGNGYPLQYSCLENSMTEDLVGYRP